MSVYSPASIKFPNCCALTEKGRCTRLTFYYCQGEKCTFKKSLNQELSSIQYSYQRLSNLDIAKQIYISKKYYHGFMPWNKKSFE